MVLSPVILHESVEDDEGLVSGLDYMLKKRFQWKDKRHGAVRHEDTIDKSSRLQCCRVRWIKSVGQEDDDTKEEWQEDECQ